jgi:hypothetical protein
LALKKRLWRLDRLAFCRRLKKAKEVEQAYELGDNRPPLEGLTGRIEDQVVRAVRQEMSHLRTSTWEREMWENRRLENRPEPRVLPRDLGHAHEGPRAQSPERNRTLNQTPVRPPPSPARPPITENVQGDAFNGRCPRCLRRGHRVRDCPNPSAVPRHDCCGWYGRHFTGCVNASAQDRERAPINARPQGVVNVVSGSEPILPYSVEVHHESMDLDSGPSTLGVVNEASGNEPVHTKSFNEGCERCPPAGHKYHNCPKRRASLNHECCGGLEKHLMNRPQGSIRSKEGLPENALLPGKVNVVLGAEPLLPHSVEVQHNWTQSELYPHSSFTFKPAQPTSVGAKRKEKSGEAESESEEDDKYSSSEDEGEGFIRGALNKKKREAPKEYLPKHREPVVNPLSVEERVKRNETRVLNWEACRQRHLAMIKAIMGDVMDKLNTHRHI